jgi:hypothetical protein
MERKETKRNKRERNKEKQVSGEQKQESKHEQKQQGCKLVVAYDQTARRVLLFPCCLLRAKQRKKGRDTSGA